MGTIHGFVKIITRQCVVACLYNSHILKDEQMGFTFKINLICMVSLSPNQTTQWEFLSKFKTHIMKSLAYTSHFCSRISLIKSYRVLFNSVEGQQSNKGFIVAFFFQMLMVTFASPADIFSDKCDIFGEHFEFLVKILVLLLFQFSHEARFSSLRFRSSSQEVTGKQS